MTKLTTIIKQQESDHYDLLDSEKRQFLQNFFMHLIHKPVAFTALGFFTINQALLASIITGIVSYQIILVEFYAA